MMGRTHLAIGILLGLLLLPFISVPSVFVFLLLISIGALLPDIDHEHSTMNRICPVTRIVPTFFKHRGFFHSIFPPALLLAIFWYFGENFVGLSLTLGYLSHLLSDSLTRMGVNLLYPVSLWRMQGPFETGKLMETVLFFSVLALIVVTLVVR
ncbi:MAG TPA: metal-dependent hydrolase [Candidatus Binatia bacterium]|nr:metal-dependent hydrolase [Candidatus Binatia bacterium]